MTARAHTKIIVAGAGTVGLAVAALLATGRAADRLAVHVLDAKPLPRWRADDVHLRVYALSRASQQLLEQVGVWPRVLGLRARRRIGACTCGKASSRSRAGALEFDSADIGEPDLGHIVEDSLLRTVLADVLAAAPNAEIGVGAALESIDVGARGVTVQLANGGSVAGTLLVAADGSDSAVRRLLDLPVTGHAYGQTAVVAHVTTEAPHRSTAWQRFLPGGPLAFLPLADGRSSIVWSLPTARRGAPARRDRRRISRRASGRERGRARRAHGVFRARGFRVAGAARAALLRRRAPRSSATLRTPCIRSRGRA